MNTKYALVHYTSNDYISRDKGDHADLYNRSATIEDAIAYYCKRYSTEPLKIAMAPNEYFVFVVVYHYGEGIGRIHDITRLDCFQAEKVTE
jgi:hypothetical protein